MVKKLSFFMCSWSSFNVVIITSYLNFNTSIFWIFKLEALRKLKITQQNIKATLQKKLNHIIMHEKNILGRI